MVRMRMTTDENRTRSAMTSTTVNEVRVEDGFVKATFGGLELVFKEQIGSINATQLCLFGGKRLPRYNELPEKMKLKRTLTKCYQDLTHKVNANRDPRLVGTYVHPALLLDVAAWLSPEIYVLSAVIIEAFFNRTTQRQWLLGKLFVCEQMATYEMSPPNCRIRLGNLGLPVNELAWFETSNLYSARFERRKDVVSWLAFFHAKGLFQGLYYHPLLFLRLAAWFNADIYVRCVRVVLCCDNVRLNSLFRTAITTAGASTNVKSAATPNQSTTKRSAVPTSPRVRLTVIAAAGSSSKARALDPSKTNGTASAGCSSKVKPILAPARLKTKNVATAGSPSEVRSTVTPAQSMTDRMRTSGASSSVKPAVASARSTTNGAFSSVKSAYLSATNGGRQPVDLGAPSTSSGPAAPRQPNSGDVTWIETDEDSEDSNMTMDMGTEDENILTRREHEAKMDQLRREFEKVVERERREKEEALAREREKEEALKRTEMEKRAAMERERLKDDQLENLRQQLENLEIRESRRELRKRSHVDSRANAAATIVKDVGVASLECVVLFVSANNLTYGIRRQLQTIIPIIHKQLCRVDKFLGWFVTINAVLDYNRCKTLVAEKARKCGRTVRCLQNEIVLEDADGEEFDLPNAVYTTLCVDLEVIEADVKILARLFRRPTYHVENSVPADRQTLASSSAFLDKVHNWIEDEHANFMRTVEKRQQRQKLLARR